MLIPIDVWSDIFMSKYMPFQEIMKLKCVSKELNKCANNYELLLPYASMSESEKRIHRQAYKDLSFKLRMELDIDRSKQMTVSINKQDEVSVEYWKSINNIATLFLLRVQLEIKMHPQTIFVAWHFLIHLLNDIKIDIHDLKYYTMHCVMIAIISVDHRECFLQCENMMSEMIPNFDMDYFHEKIKECTRVLGSLNETQPNASDFISLFAFAANIQPNTELCELLCLFAYIDERIRSDCRASLIVAAAIMCTRKLTGKRLWNNMITSFIGHEEDDVRAEHSTLF